VQRDRFLAKFWLTPVALASSRQFASHELRVLQKHVEYNREQLNHYELLGDGEGLHWPDIDEDLSVRGLLRGEQ